MNALNRKKIESALEFIEEGMKDLRRLLADGEDGPTPTAPQIQLTLPEGGNGRYMRSPTATIPAPIRGEPEYISMAQAVLKFGKSNGWFLRRIESEEIKAKLHPRQDGTEKRKHWYVCQQDIRILLAGGSHFPIVPTAP